MKKKRVVITGIGLVTPIGTGKDEFWENCLKGTSGIKKITAFDVAEYDTKIAAVIDRFNPQGFIDKVTIRRTDKFVQFAIVAAQLAIIDSSIKGKYIPENTSVFMGTGIGGMFFCETQIVEIIKRGRRACNPTTIPKIMPNAVTNQISLQFNSKSENITICTACSSGTHAVGMAFNSIKSEKSKVAIAGGSESPIMQFNFAAFDALSVMSRKNEDFQKASCPFDKNRDGFVMGEGASVLILEELEHAKKRNANIYAEIISYSATSGAYHIVAPNPDGSDIVRAMDICLKDASVGPEKIGYINAHGTSTKANDSVETKAIKEVFKKYAYKIPISSTKSMTGHVVGASGAIEAAVCALTIKTSKIHPTINLQTPDPECDLNYVPNKMIEKDITYALSNSFAFGNNNACLLFKKYKG